MGSVAGPVSAFGGAGACSDCGSCARDGAGEKSVPAAIIKAKHSLITIPAATIRFIESFRPYQNGLVSEATYRFN